jgi:hypothetical protein
MYHRPYLVATSTNQSLFHVVYVAVTLAQSCNRRANWKTRKRMIILFVLALQALRGANIWLSFLRITLHHTS